MRSSRRTILAAGAGLAVSPLPVVAATDGVAAELLARSAEGQAALMQGDARRYFEVVPLGDDFTLMSPFGGTPPTAPTRRNRWRGSGTSSATAASPG